MAVDPNTLKDGDKVQIAWEDSPLTVRLWRVNGFVQEIQFRTADGGTRIFLDEWGGVPWMQMKRVK
jgi:hypothetical protein